MSQADAPTSDAPCKSRRRWFQFSVRSLLILTTVIAFCLAGWAYKPMRQRVAVNKIRSLGGQITYDFEELYLERPLRKPAWLVDALGEDFFAEVTAVDLRYKQIDDEDDVLVQVSALTELRVLDLSGTQLNDAGLEHLHGLKSLEHLGLNRTRVTAAGAERLQKALPDCKLMPPISYFRTKRPS